MHASKQHLALALAIHGFVLGTSTPAQEVTVLTAGIADDFALPAEPAEPDAELRAWLLAGYPTPELNFDGVSGNRGFGHTFAGLPTNVVGATLEIHLKGLPGGCSNDSISIGSPWNDARWNKRLSDLIGVWELGQKATFVLDLANLPVSNGGISSVVDLMNIDRTLDFRLHEDTAVDYAILTVTSEALVQPPLEPGPYTRLATRPAGDGACHPLPPITVGPGGTVQGFSGAYVSSSLDLAVPAISQGLDWQREYRSSVGPTTAQGARWDHAYNLRLEVLGPGEGLRLHKGNGRADTYLPAGPGTWRSPGFFEEITLAANGTYVVTFPDTGTWRFKASEANLLASAGEESEGSSTPRSATVSSPTSAGSVIQLGYPIALTGGGLGGLLDVAKGRGNLVVGERRSPYRGRLRHRSFLRVPEGAPLGSSDRNGNELAYGYDAQGRLSRITDELGRITRVDYGAGGSIGGVTDSEGRQVLYAYYQDGDADGGEGDLKSVTTPPVLGTPHGNDFPAGRTTTYTYTTGFADERLDHLLVSTVDGKGQTYRTNVYAHTIDPADYRHTTDPEDLYFGRVVQQIEGDPGDITDFAYEPQVPTAANRFAVMKTIVNDRVGNVSEFLYDAGNRLVIRREYTGRAPDADAPTSSNTNRPANPLRAGDPAFYETWWEYNADSLVTRIGHADGSEETFLYDETNPSRRSQGNLLEHCVLPGPLGGDQATICESFEYDDTLGAGCCGTNFVTRHVDGNGNETLHTYDERGNRTHTQHPLPSVVEDFEWDDRGRMTAHVLPDNGSGHRRRDEFTYHGRGAQVGYLHQQIVDATGLSLTTTYEYDGVGNVVRIVDPAGRDTLIQRNALNEVVRELSPEVDAGGVRYETLTWYDANGNTVRRDVENRDATGALDPNTHFTSVYEYEVLDQLVRETHEVGSHTGAIPGTPQLPTGTGLPAAEFATTEYAYDANRNLTLVASGEAVEGRQAENRIQTSYDERDLVHQIVRAPGGADQSTTRFDHDMMGRPLVVTQGVEDGAGARVTTTLHDGYGRVTSVTDPMGNVTETSYDANGNVVGTLRLGELTDLPGSGTNVRLAESTYVHDAMDRQLRTEVHHFDAGTQAAVGDGLAVTEFEYSGTSRTTLVRNDNGHATTTTYDSADRVLTVTGADGSTVTRAYDQSSNVIAIHEVEQSDLGTQDEFTTTFGYDGLDRPTLTTDNVGNQSRAAYDSRGNVTVETDALGNVVRSAYDGLSRLVTTTRELTDTGAGGGAPVGTIETHQAWDDNSRLVARIDDNGNATTFEYDALDRQVRTVNADGTEHTATFDVHGNRTRSTDPNGSIVDYTYDLGDRLTSKIATPGAGVADDVVVESFAYDGLSRWIVANDDDSSLARTHDSLSGIVSETLDGRTTSRTFDGVGNVLQVTYPGGRTITRTYDELERVATISEGLASIAAYDHAGPGRVAVRENGNGTRSTWVHDGITGTPDPVGDFGVKRVVRTTHERVSDGHVFDDREFTWDPVGNKTRRAELAGLGDVLDYGYDSVYRLVSSVRSSSRAGAGPLAYQLDGVGNREVVTGRTDPGVYTLDPAAPPADLAMNQYTTTPMDVVREYDANGNLVTAGGGGSNLSMGYDHRNRMVSHEDSTSGSQATYAYDALGRRIARWVDGTETRYLYDGWQVCEEQDGSGATLATYVYGPYIDDVLTMRRGGVDYHYHADDLFNVTAVTDGLGSVVERYAYDDYGQVEFLDASGSPLAASAIGNPYLFTGRRFDDESGWYHYRTRSLDPAAGRFTTRDTIGTWGDPASLGNAYAYAGSNPWSAVDPLGQAMAKEKGKIIWINNPQKVPQISGGIACSDEKDDKTGDGKGHETTSESGSFRFSAEGNGGKKKRKGVVEWIYSDPSDRVSGNTHDGGCTNGCSCGKGHETTSETGSFKVSGGACWCNGPHYPSEHPPRNPHEMEESESGSFKVSGMPDEGSTVIDRAPLVSDWSGSSRGVPAIVVFMNKVSVSAGGPGIGLGSSDQIAGGPYRKVIRHKMSRRERRAKLR
jgi:RHS repeat-associated protein